MRRFVLTVLVGTAVLSAAGLVLALQSGRLIKRIEDQAGIHLDLTPASLPAPGSAPPARRSR
jgi:hypothetical protein